MYLLSNPWLKSRKNVFWPPFWKMADPHPWDLHRFSPDFVYWLFIPIGTTYQKAWCFWNKKCIMRRPTAHTNVLQELRGVTQHDSRLDFHKIEQPRWSLPTKICVLSMTEMPWQETKLFLSLKMDKFLDNDHVSWIMTNSWLWHKSRMKSILSATRP